MITGENLEKIAEEVNQLVGLTSANVESLMERIAGTSLAGGWFGKIATLLALVLYGGWATFLSVVTLAFLPILLVGIAGILLVDFLLILPLTGEFFTPGKRGGTRTLPQPLVWAVRVCLALICLILLLAWLLFG
jgi:hypothetical protein